MNPSFMQNQIKKAGTLALVAAAFVSLTTACSTTSNDTYSSSTNKSTWVNEKKVRFKGTVVYHNDRYHREHNARYTIVSEGGQTYCPVSLPSRYRKSGLRVQVYGETRGYACNGDARRLEIYDIAALSY